MFKAYNSAKLINLNAFSLVISTCVTPTNVFLSHCCEDVVKVFSMLSCSAFIAIFRICSILRVTESEAAVDGHSLKINK